MARKRSDEEHSNSALNTVTNKRESTARAQRDDKQKSKRPTSGFGSIERRGNSFRAVYRVQGRKRYGPMAYPTWEAADKYLSVTHADLIRGTWTGDVPRVSLPTLGGYGERVIAQRRGIKSSTRAQYALDWRLHVEPYIGRFTLDEVTPDLVRQWLEELGEDLREKLTAQKRWSRASRRDGSATVARAYRTLHTVMGVAVDEELIARTPCRVKGAGESKPMEAATLSVAEVDALAKSVPPHYRAFVYVAAFMALRVGEIADLRIRDLNLSAKPSVTVRERVYRVDGRLDYDSPKSDAGARTFAMSREMRTALAGHLREHRKGAGPDDFVFVTTGGRPVIDSYSNVMRRALNRIGRDDVRFHGTRHTGCVLMVEAGATMAELMLVMGHSSMDASRRYLHAGEDHGRAVADEVGRRAAATRQGGKVVALSTARRRRRAASA